MGREMGLGVENSGGAHPKRWRSSHLTDNRVILAGRLVWVQCLGGQNGAAGGVEGSKTPCIGEVGKGAIEGIGKLSFLFVFFIFLFSDLVGASIPGVKEERKSLVWVALAPSVRRFRKGKDRLRG